MTATYDPTDPKYFDPAALTVELDRVFDLCHGCRLCFNLCPSFPTLFRFIDANDGDVSALTDDERDQVVDECYQCKLCYVKCPYVPPHEWQLDFPRLMSRVHAVRQKQGVGMRERLTDQFLGRTDLLGRASVMGAPVVNWATGTPGTWTRRVMEKTVGLASERLLPPYARQRFTTWFRKRDGPAAAPGGVGAVSVFPTCFVEYMDPDVGKDIVRVYEHNGLACALPEGTRCCGAPWLHSGNLQQFDRAARRNVAALASEVRSGRDVVVAQPTCAYVIKRDYPLYVRGADADLVAAHTYDPAEYLMKRHKDGEDPFSLRTEFPGRHEGAVPDSVTYHVACHLQAQNAGLKSRDLLKVAGVRCTLVQRCSGIDGTWGYRAVHYDMAREVAAPLAREIRTAGNETVCGDCHLANGAILQETGSKPVHPMQLVARAYGVGGTP
ncbi:MAG TPA: heterodisulfide reductase-related iron-sulfur binding cluster [Acidimicrobiales bacterium]|nr:heterodisulfide reductase-related iron-sulfur binding cluster [Acidimicrobiales bacterium]